MSGPETTYAKIAKAIGNVCIVWSSIDHLVHDLILHLAVCLEPSFDNESSWNILHIILSNEDTRKKLVTIKVLAHQLESKASPDFYDRVTELINFLDSDLRLERNRYVHDYWFDEGEEIVRSYLGARIRNTQARKREITLMTERRFANVAEIEDLVTALGIMYDDLVTLDNHIAGLTSLRDQSSIQPQPIPRVWQSLAHRDLRDRGKP